MAQEGYAVEAISLSAKTVAVSTEMLRSTVLVRHSQLTECMRAAGGRGLGLQVVLPLYASSRIAPSHARAFIHFLAPGILMMRKP